MLKTKVFNLEVVYLRMRAGCCQIFLRYRPIFSKNPSIWIGSNRLIAAALGELFEISVPDRRGLACQTCTKSVSVFGTLSKRSSLGPGREIPQRGHRPPA